MTNTDQRKHTAPSVAIAVMAEHDAADRPREIAGGKRGKRGHQGRERRARGKDGVGDVTGEDAEDDEVVELERAAQAGKQHDAPAGSRDAIVHVTAVSLRLFGALAVDLPGNAEAIDQHAKTLRPERLLERHDDRFHPAPARGKTRSASAVLFI
jgi:hypothetical protein